MQKNNRYKKLIIYCNLIKNLSFKMKLMLRMKITNILKFEKLTQFCFSLKMIFKKNSKK